MRKDDDAVFRAARFWLRPQWQRDQEAESASRFSREAEQEMLRLILDVQQNRNRPEDLP